jgi:hypothetical protein
MHKVAAGIQLKRESALSEFFWIKLWIYFSAWASASGWLLSKIHLLNRVGYVFALLVGSLLFWLMNRKQIFRGIRLSGFRNRLRRPLPALFLGVSAFSFLGGSLYAPNNYDFLTYRFPRILHWASENQWHWIHTMDPRLNYSATGFEWLMMPLFVFFHTDRLFFLINFLSFCFMPGLVFSLFRNLGISGKNSWIWMWLLPSGYCYALQAGSVANDSFSTTYILAAILFSLKARKENNIHYFWISFLAICLFTGTKLSNLPLVLPWLLLSWPTLNQAVKYPWRLIAIVCFGFLISIAPVLILNQIHAGSWTGNRDVNEMLRVQPLAGVIGNVLQLITGNLLPPLFPWASVWNRSLPEFTALHRGFPRFSLQAGEIQIEEIAGIGMGVTLFFLLSILFAKSSRKSLPLNLKLFLASIFVSILLFMAALGSESFPRLFAPYYAIVIAAMILLVNPKVSAKWSRLALLAALSSLIPLILSPSRPLWPALSTIKMLQENYADNPRLQRAFEVYSVYRNRSDSLAPLRGAIPEHTMQVGFLSSGDDPESPLWIPFSSRRVIDLIPDDHPCESGVSIIVINENALPSGLQNWMSRNSGNVLAEELVITKVSVGAENWAIVQLNCRTSR